jgi:sortase A
VVTETAGTTASTDSAGASVPEQGGNLQDYGTVATGQGIGSITIEKIALSTFVVAGTGPDQLAIAVGHLSSTPAPGQIGNAVLVGLRASQLAPFKELDQMRIGDVIEIDTSPGGTYFYRVTTATVEEPTATNVITDADEGVATLTLITCAPQGEVKQRLVVRASLVEELSSPVGAGEPNYGQAGDPPADSYEPCNMIPAEVAATSTTG